jgi:flavin reductase
MLPGARTLPVIRDEFREAMARLGAAVNIITTGGPAGKRGFTASAVCSVTDNPPTLLICVNRGSDSHDILAANGVLCVNTLASRQQPLSPIFGGMANTDNHDERFAHGEWHTLITGAPVLKGAAVNFDCRISQLVEVGTHSVFFCEVDAIAMGDNSDGLIYHGRRYHRVASG